MRAPGSAIPVDRYRQRLAAAQARVAGAGLEAILVGVGPDLRYLTGYPAMPLERLTMLVIPAQGDLALVVPRLEATPARSCPAAAEGDLTVVTWEEGDYAYAVVAGIVHNAVAAARGVIAAARGLGQRLAVSDDLAARHLLPIQERVSPMRVELASPTLRELRIIKDRDEIETLRRAAQAADRVVAAIAAGRLVGRTEEDVAHEVRERLIAEGHDEATFAIVGSGPNSASPHHGASAQA